MRIYNYIARIVREHPWWMVVAALMITVAFIPGLFLINGEVSQNSMIPPGAPSRKAIKDLDRIFGGTSYENILIYAPRVTNNTVTQFLVGLEDYINQDPQLSEAVSKLPGKSGSNVPEILRKPVPIIQDYLTPFIANIKQGIADSGFNISLSGITNEQIKSQTGKDFQQTVEQEYLSVPEVQQSQVGQQKFMSPDYKYTLVLIKQNPKLTDSQQVAFANNIEKLFKTHLSGVKGLKIWSLGDATIARDFNNHIRNKTALLFLLSIAFVLLTLFIAFRRLSDTFVPIGVMVVSLVWTFGLMGYAGVPYSIAAVAIMPVLLGHALTFVVPFIARYYEEEEAVHGTAVAASRTLMSVGMALFPAAATSVVGFLVFLFSIIPPLQNFGLTSAVGTAFLFMLSITVLPALLIIRDRKMEAAATPEERAAQQSHFDGFRRRQKRGLYARGTEYILHWSFDFSTRYPVWIIVGSVVLIGLGISGSASLKTDADLRKLIPRNLPQIAADMEIEKVFGPDQTDFILVSGDVLEPKNLQAMLDTETAMANDPRGKYSYYDKSLHREVKGEYYPRNGMNSLADAVVSANNGVMPADRAGVLAALDTAKANGGYIGGVLAPDQRHALISLNGRAALDDAAINTKMSIMNDNSKKFLVSGAGLDYELGGTTPITNDLTRNIIPVETVTSVLSLVICGLLLMLIFLSIPYGLITLSVAFAGVAGEIGFLWLMGWPLDVITSLTSALVIAIGSNFGILFTHRFMQAMQKGDRTPLEGIRDVIFNLGRANVLAGAATCAGFLIIMLSQIEPLKRFGGVTAFGILWSLIASLTVLPSLLFLWARHKARVAEESLPEPELAPG
jgi:predicted RND superfamily exporter protein